MMNAMTLGERKLSRSMLLVLSLSLFVLISLYIFLFAPLYVLFANDVLYQSTVLPEVFSLCSALVDILVFSSFYGILLYSIYRFSLKKSVPLIAIYGIGIFYKNVGNILMTFATDGVPSDATEDLLTALIYIMLELLQGALVVVIGTVTLYHAQSREKIRKDAALRAKKEYVPLAEFFPFSTLLNFKNPIQKAAFWMASVPMFVKIGSRLIYDVWYTVMNGFAGIADILWMLLYYTLDILGYGLIVYFVMLLLLSHFNKKDLTLSSEPTETDADPLSEI